MPQNTNHTERSDYIKGHAQSLRQTLNRLMIMAARVILAGLLLNLIIQSFMVSPEAGARSLAATILPLLITGYLSFANKSHQALGVTHQLVDFIFYFLSSVWMIFLLLFTRYAIVYYNREIPLGEFVISLTLSLYIFITGRLPFRSLVACAYGIISGLLIYILLFGPDF
ncbi:hypothetical protein IFO70_09395 [Phormidium tenue FACHB-886]|nr:hypothetical protein [Phormidium tenue FACHB-886]